MDTMKHERHSPLRLLCLTSASGQARKRWPADAGSITVHGLGSGSRSRRQVVSSRADDATDGPHTHTPASALLLCIAVRAAVHCNVVCNIVSNSRIVMH